MNFFLQVDTILLLKRQSIGIVYCCVAFSLILDCRGTRYKLCLEQLIWR